MSLPLQDPSSPAHVPLVGGRLPRTAIPSHYRLHLHPDIDDGTFRGAVQIALDVPEATRFLVLHAIGLEVEHCRLDSGLAPERIAVCEADETLTLAFDEAIPAGAHHLDIAFHGRMETVPYGLHVQPYQEGGRTRTMIATQFEPTDARRMLPLWDEPAYRATFELSVDLPASFQAISNMPIAATEDLPEDTRRVTFQTTPSMPSYLLVLCAGDLEYLERREAGVDIRVYTALGKKDTGRFALESAAKLLSWYNDYFGVPYPLPKLDLIAIPGGFEGAMENWGGITFNEATLLFDPRSSSLSTKERIFSIVAHEVAHQWFGNLVTMAWWDDLWLNEGFATWMATKATDHFNPGWREWPRANCSKNWAMDADARPTTHPIQQTVESASVAVSRFDEISYEKGQAVIRMIEGYLGEDVFRSALRSYMKVHAYGNATTADLWAALGEASGQPVMSIARSWIEQPGFPLVTADLERREGSAAVAVRQQRFVLDDPGAAPLRWRLPLTYGVAGQKHQMLLDGEEALLPLGDAGALLKLNWGDSGYFRAWHRGDLGERLRAAFPTLDEADRVALLADAWALALARLAPVEEYLALVDVARQDDSLAVWRQILDAFDKIDLLLVDSPGRPEFHAAARRVFGVIAGRLGWEEQTGEPEVWPLLRLRLLSVLGRFGDEAVREEAERRFERFLADPRSLPGNLRAPVLGTVGRFATPARYDALHGLAVAAERIEDRDQLYWALCRALDPDLARRTLAISLEDEAEPTLASNLVLDVAYGEHRDLATAFAREHLEALLAKRDVLGRFKFLPEAYQSYSDESKADEMEAVARQALPVAAWPEVEKMSERIRFQARLRATLLPGVGRWVAAQGARR